MKKLLIIGSNTIHILNYINLVHDYFSEIHFITDSKNNQLEYKNVNITYTTFSTKKPFSFLKSIRIIKKIILKFDPAIIHVHQLTSHALLAILANRKINKPSLYTAWGSDVLYVPKTGFWYFKMIRYILIHAKYFTSDSKYMADVMRKIAAKPLNILIANFGINIEKSTVIEKQNVIYSNRQLKKIYRIDVILIAFSRFLENSEDKNWKLIIGAEGDEKQTLINLTHKLKLSDKVEFVGWLDKEQNSFYYNIARFYISIPESDATSISLLEAMAAGCIPVLSDLPANREWVENNVNGIIVDNIDSNFIECANKIDFIKAQSLNKQIIEERGTKNANKQKFLNFYDQIISKKL